jgi:hypothetical protein
MPVSFGGAQIVEPVHPGLASRPPRVAKMGVGHTREVGARPRRRSSQPFGRQDIATVVRGGHEHGGHTTGNDRRDDYGWGHAFRLPSPHPTRLCHSDWPGS